MAPLTVLHQSEALKLRYIFKNVTSYTGCLGAYDKGLDRHSYGRVNWFLGLRGLVRVSTKEES